MTTSIATQDVGIAPEPMSTTPSGPGRDPAQPPQQQKLDPAASNSTPHPRPFPPASTNDFRATLAAIPQHIASGFTTASFPSPAFTVFAAQAPIFLIASLAFYLVAALPAASGLVYPFASETALRSFSANCAQPVFCLLSLALTIWVLFQDSLRAEGGWMSREETGNYSVGLLGMALLQCGAVVMMGGSWAGVGACLGLGGGMVGGYLALLGRLQRRRGLLGVEGGCGRDGEEKKDKEVGGVDGVVESTKAALGSSCDHRLSRAKREVQAEIKALPMSPEKRVVELEKLVHRQTAYYNKLLVRKDHEVIADKAKLEKLKGLVDRAMTGSSHIWASRVKEYESIIEGLRDGYWKTKRDLRQATEAHLAELQALREEQSVQLKQKGQLHAKTMFMQMKLTRDVEEEVRELKKEKTELKDQLTVASLATKDEIQHLQEQCRDLTQQLSQSDHIINTLNEAVTTSDHRLREATSTNHSLTARLQSQQQDYAVLHDLHTKQADTLRDQAYCLTRAEDAEADLRDLLDELHEQHHLKVLELQHARDASLEEQRKRILLDAHKDFDEFLKCRQRAHEAEKERQANALESAWSAYHHRALAQLAEAKDEEMAGVRARMGGVVREWRRRVRGLVAAHEGELGNAWGNAQFAYEQMVKVREREERGRGAVQGWEEVGEGEREEAVLGVGCFGGECGLVGCFCGRVVGVVDEGYLSVCREDVAFNEGGRWEVEGETMGCVDEGVRRESGVASEDTGCVLVDSEDINGVDDDGEVESSSMGDMSDLESDYALDDEVHV